MDPLRRKVYHDLDVIFFYEKWFYLHPMMQLAQFWEHIDLEKEYMEIIKTGKPVFTWNT